MYNHNCKFLVIGKVIVIITAASFEQYNMKYPYLSTSCNKLQDAIFKKEHHSKKEFFQLSTSI